MTTLRHALSTLCALALLTAGAAGADQLPLTFDRVNLSVQSGQQVDNDTLVAVLYAQRDGSDAAGLAREVNRAVAAAVAAAREQPTIEVQTLDYTTTPRYQKQVLTGWQVRQSLRLQSQDVATLSALIGELQGQLAVGSISYRISPQRRQEVEDGLIREALAAFKRRARLVAHEMGRSGFRVVDIDINTAHPSPRPQPMRAMAMAAEAAPAPTIEAGKQRVEVSIHGTIQLSRP